MGVAEVGEGQDWICNVKVPHGGLKGGGGAWQLRYCCSTQQLTIQQYENGEQHTLALDDGIRCRQ